MVATKDTTAILTTPFTSLRLHEQYAWCNGYTSARHGYPVEVAAKVHGSRNQQMAYVAGHLTASNLHAGQDGRRIVSADTAVFQ